MTKLRSWIVYDLTVLSLIFPLPLVGQVCGDAPAFPPMCSYSALNGSCSIVIDRLNAATPPTIYMRRRAVLSVHVVDLSAFETLSLDASYPATAVPPDAFAAGMAALSATFGKLTVVEPQFGKAGGAGFVGGDEEAIKRAIQDILNKQKSLKSDLDGKDPLALAQGSLKLISVALQAPAADICLQRNSAKPNDPWVHFAQWKSDVSIGLGKAMNAPSDIEISALNDRVKALDNQIAVLATSDSFESFGAQNILTILKATQTSLQGRVDALSQTNQKLNALSKAVKDLIGPEVDVQFDIKDQQPADKNFQIETYTLNYANALLPNAKRVTATPMVSSSQAALAGIADGPAKQKIIALTVSYQSSPRLEFSTGVMVPVRPFHSYVAAGGVVQENLTYTVVPIANTNILIGRELVASRQRVAFFGSIAVGYNPATSAVEFGVGPTFSWRSIQLSGMADIGRDTRLRGVLIGAAASSTPPTETYWTVKPAISLSVRLPLGGK